jgi:DNA-binding transcriptional LysR family regulator
MKIPCILAILAHLNYGRLRIGANESISWHLFPELAKALLQLHSGIRIELRCGRSESLLADLKERKLDLVLISFKPRDSGCESRFIT